MAVSTLRDNVGRMFFAQLEPRLRYRCLLIQSPDLQLLKSIQGDIESLLAAEGATAVVVDGRKQFDSVGAVACQDLLATISDAAVTQYIIVAGPLHFLDYWSRQVRNAFWSHLATITRGLGIIVLDVPREAEIEESFRTVGKISGADAKYLKSRLAITQDGLV